MEWLLFFQIIIIFLFLDLKFRNKITYILFLIPLFSLGFRYKVGWDYDAYFKFFYGLKNVYEGSSYGFKLIKNLFYNLNLNFQTFIFFINFFRVMTIAYISNKICRYRALAIYLYMIIPFFMYRELSTLRQTIAEIFFILFIYNFLLKERKRGLLFQLGLFFHPSLILANLFIIFIRLKIKKKVRYICILIFFSLGYFIKGILFNFKTFFQSSIVDKYLGYIFFSKYGTFYNNKNGLNLLLLLVLLLIFIKFQEIFEKKRKMIFLYNCFYFGVLYLVSILWLPSPVGRISYYVLIQVIFLIPIFIDRLKSNRFIKKRQKSFALGVVYCSIFMFSIFFVYENILFPRNTQNSLTNNTLKYKFEIFK